MGSFSIWHWLIVLVLFAIPLFFAFREPPKGPNRYGEPALSVDFFTAIKLFFSKYFDFKSRASRSEFWYAFLLMFLVSFTVETFARVMPQPVPALIYLGTLIPYFAVSARRLHDINRSGWHQILTYLGPVGFIVTLIWYCKGPVDGSELAYATAPAPLPTTPPPAPASRGPLNASSLEMIEKLAKLKESGAITEEEYNLQKNFLLNN